MTSSLWYPYTYENIRVKDRKFLGNRSARCSPAHRPALPGAPCVRHSLRYVLPCTALPCLVPRALNSFPDWGFSSTRAVCIQLELLKEQSLQLFFFFTHEKPVGKLQEACLCGVIYTGTAVGAQFRTSKSWNSTSNRRKRAYPSRA